MLNQSPTSLKDCYTHRATQSDERKLRGLLMLKEEIKDLNNIGRSCHVVYNYVSMNYAYVDHRFKDLTGYESDDLLIRGNYFITTRLMDPEDVASYYKILKKINEYLLHVPCNAQSEYQVSFDYRIKLRDGKKIRLLQQIVAMEFDEQGRLMYTLDRLTDITHWEKDDEMVLTITGPNPSHQLIYYPGRTVQEQITDIFSKTEIKILRLLAEGLSSKEIAERASISFNTVNTHRRNMIRKASVKNTSELIQYAYMHKVI